MMDLNTFMAAIRRLETGSWEGNYQAVGVSTPAGRPVGAYQILEHQWPYMATMAGIPGADWRDPMAQDLVAGTIMAQFQARYGSWDLVAAAWYGGTRNADIIANNGYEGPASIRSKSIGKYVARARQLIEEAPADLPDVAPDVMRTPDGWVMPVAGQNKWSKGSFGYHRSAGAIAGGKTPVHEGIDIYAAKGTPVVAPVGGKVIGSGRGDKGGNWVKILGDDGIYYYFAHLDQRAARKGDRLEPGHVIGTVGNTGNARSTKPHLHFTMRWKSNSRLINPASYLSGATTPGRPQQDTTPGQNRPQTNAAAQMNGMMQALSEQMAGGDRQDWRTMGQPQDSDTEGIGDPLPEEADTLSRTGVR